MSTINISSRKEHEDFQYNKLVQHLTSKHIAEFKKYQKTEKKLKLLINNKQLPLEATEDRVKLWNFYDPRAQRIIHRIGEMVALDCQPFSIVEDTGFLRLMKQVEP